MSMQNTHSEDRTLTQTRRAVLRSVAGGAVASAFLAGGWAIDAAAARSNFEMGGLTGPSMPVKVVVVYGHPDDPDAFESYFREKHVPIANRMPFCASIESALAVSGVEGEDASFHRVSTVTFNSQADMIACLTSEAGQAAVADIANFATGGATATIVSDIQTFQPTGENAPRSRPNVGNPTLHQ